MIERIKDETLGEGYSLHRHPSGLRIYIANKPGFSSYHAIFGTVYGSLDTDFSKNGEPPVSVPEGIAHFLEHKLFESEELDAFELFSKTGAYANAYTSFDKTCYLFGCSGNFEENLKILLGFVSSPYFTAETVKKEQGIIGQEIVMYDDSPDWRVMFNLLRALYHKNPVRIDIAGTVQSISHIDDKLLYECYNTFYNPENMFLVLVGDIDEENILRLINENLKAREGVKIERIKSDEPKEIKEAYTECRLAVSEELFMIGFKDVAEGYAPPKRQIEMEILLEMLAGKASPLYKKLLDEGLIGASLDSEYFVTRDVACVLIGGEGKNGKRISEEILKEAQKMREEGLDTELFEAIRRSKYGEAVMSFDNVQSVASRLVSAAVSGSGAYDDIEALKNIKADDLKGCLELIKEENMALSVVKGE